MTEIIGGMDELEQDLSGFQEERYVHVADKLRDFGKVIDSILDGVEHKTAIKFIEETDKSGNKLMLAKTTPSTSGAIGFAYIVERQCAPRQNGENGQFVRYSWHPMMTQSRNEQRYSWIDCASPSSPIEDRGFDLPDIDTINGIINIFKTKVK